jgi:ubiquinone/menaquinone biosynthesis C-methylase UbiE
MTSKPATDLSNDERLRLEFNDWAAAGRGASMEKGHRPIGEQAIALMNLPANARVLDIGCGSGWATRLMAEQANEGQITGIDISDEMIEIARASSVDFTNVDYRVASAEALPFANGEFSHAFSMESLYYYSDIPAALKEIRRVLKPGGLFVTVIDLYEENRPSHQWIEQLKVPVHLLSSEQYRTLLKSAGFENVLDQRLYDPTPVPENYTGGSFKTREDYVDYKAAGSLMLSGEAMK